MRLSLQTHGGLAAALTMRLPARTLDTDDLAPDTAAELSRLVAAATAEATGAAPRARIRDGMSYTVSVVEGGTTTTLTATDAGLTPAFTALVQLIRTHAAG